VGGFTTTRSFDGAACRDAAARAFDHAVRGVHVAEIRTAAMHVGIADRETVKPFVRGQAEEAVELAARRSGAAESAGAKATVGTKSAGAQAIATKGVAAKAVTSQITGGTASAKAVASESRAAEFARANTAVTAKSVATEISTGAEAITAETAAIEAGAAELARPAEASGATEAARAVEVARAAEATCAAKASAKTAAAVEAASKSAPAAAGVGECGERRGEDASDQECELNAIGHDYVTCECDVYWMDSMQSETRARATTSWHRCA
jgi:hypothetical protein